MSHSKPIKAVFFDADGTLLDTAPSLTAVINEMCRLHNRPTVSVDQIRPSVSGGGRAMLQHAFDIQDKQHETELFSQLLELYPQFITHGLTLFNGYETVLDALEQTGIIWGVISNKPEQFLIPQMKHLKLFHRSQVTIGGDTYKNKKPHPQPLLEGCQITGLSPREVVYVGDFENDVIAAKRADMRAWIVEFGYIPTDGSHTQWGADRLITHPADLLNGLAAIRR